MKRLLALLLAGGSAALTAACSAPAPQVPAAPAPPIVGGVHVGAPGAPGRARVARNATWEVLGGGFAVKHWILDAENKRIDPEHGGLQSSLFRGTLPFPQITWGGSSIEVTQLVYPAGGGFVARYHVMNHGSDPSRCRLFIDVQPPARRDGRRLTVGSKVALVAAQDPVDAGGSALAFDFAIEPGTSRFVHVTTEPLGGAVASDSLDRAAEAWEKLLAGRRLHLPDPRATEKYHLDLAGSILGIDGCTAEVARIHDLILKKEGDALRLLSGVPPEWLMGTITAEGLPTDFGTLAFTFEGAFNSRMMELGGSCRPPGGFRLDVPRVLKARVDGKDGDVREGVLHVPAGTRQIEMPRRTD